jgi:hypothetical protein
MSQLPKGERILCFSYLESHALVFGQVFFCWLGAENNHEVGAERGAQLLLG